MSCNVYETPTCARKRMPDMAGELAPGDLVICQRQPGPYGCLASFLIERAGILNANENTTLVTAANQELLQPVQASTADCSIQH